MMIGPEPCPTSPCCLGKPGKVSTGCATCSRAAYRVAGDGAKCGIGSKLHPAVDTLGHLLPPPVTPAIRDDRAEVGRLAQAVRIATGWSVSMAHVDQDCTGPKAAGDAKAPGIELEAVKLPDIEHGVVLSPRRWVAGRPIAGRPVPAAW